MSLVRSEHLTNCYRPGICIKDIGVPLWNYEGLTFLRNVALNCHCHPKSIKNWQGILIFWVNFIQKSKRR